MNILRILKVNVLCCICTFAVNNNIVNSTQLSMRDKIEMTEAIMDDCGWRTSRNEYIDRKINGNAFIATIGYNIIIQDSNTCYKYNPNFARVTINSTNGVIRKSILSMSANDLIAQLNDKFSIYKDGDLTEILRKDAKNIFGEDYEIYYNYRNINKPLCVYYKPLFGETFDQFMKRENNQLVTKIKNYNAKFITDILYIPVLTITNNRLTYYFDLYNNLITIYTNLNNAPEIKYDITKILAKFMDKFKERAQIEQNNIKQKFGERYYAYYNITNLWY